MVKIYALESKSTGKAYIGCTAGKLNKRLREHRCILRNQTHHSPLLLNDWNKYGEDDFTMTMLCTLLPDATLEQKRQAEQSWMDWYSSQGRLYNACERSFSPTREATKKGIEASRHVIGNRNSPEANEKRRLSQLGKPKGHGAKIAATKRANAEAKRLARLVASKLEMI